MTFVNEEELKKQNKVVRDYLNNRKLLKQKLQNETIANQQLQKSTSEMFQPITKKIEQLQKEKDERQIKLLQYIQDIQQQQHFAIEEKPKSIFTVDFEKGFTDQEKQLLAQNGFETSIVELVQRGPDYINELMDRTKVFNQRLGGQRRSHKADTKLIDEQIKTFKKYREKLQSLIAGLELTVGTGFKNPNELCERLNLLVAAKQAGNNNRRLEKEIRSILNKLKSIKCISHCDHQKLSRIILK